MSITYNHDDLEVTLAIDRISLTFNITEYQKKMLLDKLDLAADTFGLNYQKAKGLDKLYKHKYIVMFPTEFTNPLWYQGFTLYLAFGNKSQKNRYFRIEYNPSLLNKTGHKIFRKFLQKLLNLTNFNNIYENAVITLVDTSLDIKNKTIEEFLFYVKKVQKSAVYTGDYGNIETVNLGSPSSRGDFLIYNKKKEALDRIKSDLKIAGKAKKDAIDDITQRPETIRIEDSDRRRKYTISNLKIKHTPYPKVEIFKNLDHIEGISPFFLDSCRLRGVSAALRRLDRKANRQHYKELCKTSISTIIPDSMYDTLWPHVVNSCLYSLYPKGIYLGYIKQRRKNMYDF